MAINILLVDDSKAMRSIVRKTLLLAKVPLGDVHEAEDGQAALYVLREKWIDLVITDIHMPVMNGEVMIAAMAEEEALKDIPVIVVSTEGSQTRIENLRNLGVQGVVRKPFTPECLRGIVLEVMKTSYAP
jgi:two-component system chemotaxis response regulator CheY